MKRIFAFFLSLLLILGICPMSALADTGGSGNVDGGGYFEKYIIAFKYFKYLKNIIKSTVMKCCGMLWNTISKNNLIYNLFS